MNKIKQNKSIKSSKKLTIKEQIIVLRSGGSKGAPPPPPLATKFFSISCSFWGKFNKFVSWRPHLRAGAPSGKILDAALSRLHGYILQKRLNIWPTFRCFFISFWIYYLLTRFWSKEKMCCLCFSLRREAT